MRSQGTRESLEFYWRSLEAPGQVNASTAFFIWLSKMTTADKHEYFKMIRAREERIRTFMQLELEACLEDVSWMLRCYHCEALDCPQEEYPARLLPTPPPSYIDNLQSRLIRARKGIFLASLKMILKTEYQLFVQRPAPKPSVQPDDMIGKHRAGENSPSPECDPSPRRAAFDTGSEKPETPPKSPAISTGSGPEASRVETQMEEEMFTFETSVDGFLRSTCTSTEQEYILLQSNVGVSDNGVQPEVGMDDNSDATTQQAAVRKEFVCPTKELQQRRTTAWATNSTSYLIGAGLCDAINFLKRESFPYVLCLACCCLFSRSLYFCPRCLLYFFHLAHKSCRSRYEERYELFGWTGCVNCCIEERSPSGVFRQ